MDTKKSKQEIIKQFAKSPSDTGSAEVQIALLQERISQIAAHVKAFPKDLHSRAGLVKLVGKKRSLSNYLQRTNKPRYDEIMSQLS